MKKEKEHFLITAFDSIVAVITRHAVKGNHHIPIQSHAMPEGICPHVCCFPISAPEQSKQAASKGSNYI